MASLLPVGELTARQQAAERPPAPDLEQLAERVKHLYDLQKNVVIVCGEGIVDKKGRELGAKPKRSIPPGTSF